MSPSPVAPAASSSGSAATAALPAGSAPSAGAPPRLTAAALERALGALPQGLLAKLEAAHFDRAHLLACAQRLGVAGPDGNRVTGVVEPPQPEDVGTVPALATAEGASAMARGREAIARGEVAMLVLAGGMATRMGGVVKGLVEALPAMTFLDYRVREVDLLRERFGGRVPLWLMTSYATDGAIAAALKPYQGGPTQREVATFVQNVSLRLTADGEIFTDKSGAPSIYASGHGDTPEALGRSGLLDAFIARGGRSVWITNIDNLGACVDPTLLGWHLAHGAPLTVEVVDKVGSDRGGIPARLDGRPVILEEFRLPRTFDAAQVRTFNTNTFLVDALALREVARPGAMSWSYFEVHKKVEERDAIQFERLLGELTSALDTRFLRVPRDGVLTRFLPVKDGPELDARRPEIAAIAAARGVVG